MANIGITLAADASGLQRTLNGAAGTVEEFSRRSGGSLKQVATEASSLQNGMDSFANGLKSALVGSSIAVGLIGLKNSLGELKDALVSTQVQADKMRNGLSFALGSGNVAKEMQFISQSAQGMGLELVSASTQYMKLAAAARGTALEGKGVKDIFTGIGQASTVMGLSAQETEGALRSIGQMISKNTIMSEELKGQLSEHLPGAFQIAARSMGVTTAELNKMLETGKVVAGDFLPKFAAQLTSDFAPQMEEAAKSMQASINRLENSWTNLKRAALDSGLDSHIVSQYSILDDGLNSVAESMQKAKKEGGGFASQMLSGAGAVALFLNPLNILNYHAESAAGKLHEMELSAKSAKVKLAEFESQLKTDPNNEWLKVNIESINQFILRLKLAKEEQNKLSSMTPVDATAAGIRLGGVARESFMAEQKQSAEELLKIKQKLAGVDADYLPTLAKLQRARELGTIEEKDYIATVQQLATANFKKAATEKAQSDTAVQDLRARITTERQYIQALQDVGLEADKANDGEKLATKLTQELTGKIDAKTRASKEAQLVEAKTLAIEISKRDAIKETLTAREKSLQAAAKEYAAREADIDKINDRAAAIEIEVASNESLAKAVELVGIARLREKRDVLANFDNAQETIALIEKEIAARERLITAMDSKESSDSLKKAAKDAEAEWKRASDEINRSITDALMRAFEDGSGFAAAFSKVVQAEFKTLVLRPMVSAVISPISQGINSAIGGVGTAGAVGAGSGSSLLTQGAGSYGASASTWLGGTMAGTAYGTGATLAGAGLGAEAFGAGVSMMQTATGFSSFMAGAGQALGAVPVVGQVLLAGAVLNALLGGDKFVSASASGRAGITYSAAGIAGDVRNTNGTADQINIATNAVNELEKAYLAAAKNLGVQAIGGAFEVGYNTGAGGASPNTVVAAAFGNSLYNSGEVSSADTAGVSLAASRAVFSALQSSELPGYLAEVFNGITASTATQDQIANTLAYATSLKAVRDTMAETRTPLEVLQATVSSSFAALGTSADTFKKDFVAAIDAGISPENLAEWQKLGTNLDAVAASAKATAAEVGGWQDKVDLLNGTVTQTELDRANALATATNATRGLINTYYDLVTATAAAKKSTESALPIGVSTELGATYYPDGSIIASAAMMAKNAINDVNAWRYQGSAPSWGDGLSPAQQLNIEQNKAFALADGADAAEAAAKSLTEAADAAKLAAAALSTFNTALGNLTDANIDLQSRMLALQGDTAGAYALTREKDLKKLTEGFTAEQSLQLTEQYDANKLLSDQIDALTQSQTDAAAAADKLKTAWESIGDTLLKEVDRIRGVMAASSADSLAALQSRFVIATAQARSGDQTAAGSLTGYSSQLLDAAAAQAGSRIELIRIQAKVAESLQNTAQVLGAPVMPVMQPPVVNTERLESSIATLSAEIVSLKTQLSAIQANTRRTADAVNGNGEAPMVVEIDA